MTSTITAGTRVDPDTQGAGHARRSRLARHLPLALSLLTAGVYSLLAVHRYWQRDISWDSAVLGQAVAAYSRLEAPVADTLGPGVNQLSDHFSPILALIAPVYRVVPHVMTLQLVQVLLIAVSVFFVARAAVRHLGVLSGGGLGLAYALSFGLQSGVDKGFHELAFAALFISISGDRYLQGRFREAALWSLPLLLVKEDMGLVVGAFGLVLVLKGCRRLGAALIGLAAAYTVIVMGVVIPALNPRGEYNFIKMATDESGGSGIGTVGALLGDMSQPVRWITVLLSLAVTAFLCVRSPYALLALPIFLERIAAPWAYYWGPYGHYNLPVMTILFVAAIEGAVLLRSSARPPLRQVGTYGGVAAGLVSLGFLPLFHLGSVLKPSAWEQTERASVLRDLIDEIPEGASVQSDSRIAALVYESHPTFTFQLPNHIPDVASGVTADYIIVDESRWDADEGSAVDYARETHPGDDYRVVYDEAGLVLLERVTS